MMGRGSSITAVSSAVVRYKIVKLYSHYADSVGDEKENFCASKRVA
jgi:hypothetical protein